MCLRSDTCWTRVTQVWRRARGSPTAVTWLFLQVIFTGLLKIMRPETYLMSGLLYNILRTSIFDLAIKPQRTKNLYLHRFNTLSDFYKQKLYILKKTNFKTSSKSFWSFPPHFKTQKKTLNLIEKPYKRTRALNLNSQLIIFI